MDLFNIWCLVFIAETMLYLFVSTNDLFIKPRFFVDPDLSF